MPDMSDKTDCYLCGHLCHNFSDPFKSCCIDCALLVSSHHHGTDYRWANSDVGFGFGWDGALDAIRNMLNLPLNNG